MPPEIEKPNPVEGESGQIYQNIVVEDGQLGSTQQIVPDEPGFNEPYDGD